jgi:CBS domain-containing protein
LQIGTKKLVAISPNANADEAAKTMKERNVGALLVVDDERLVGILTERDFFKLIAGARGSKH